MNPPYMQSRTITRPIRDFLKGKPRLPAEDVNSAVEDVEELLTMLFALAGKEDLVLDYNTKAGKSIENTCERLVVLANLLEVPLRTNFNEIEVIAHPGDDPKVLATQWQAKRHEKYP